jgi:hypothetical protein
MNPDKRDYDQPVAYDTEGRPLYYRPLDNAAPPQDPPTSTPLPAPNQTTAQASAHEESSPTDNSTWQADHDRSVHDYPEIQFSPTEYVVIDVQRSTVGLVLIWLVALLLAAFALLAAMFLPDFLATIDLGHTAGSASLATFGVAVLAIIGGFVAAWVYRANRFIVTNERIFQRLQHTPFAYRNQNIEMEHVEDCSLKQNNIFQILFNYGTIRLSTIGSEQTYRFTFVARPTEQFKVVNAVVQAVDEGAATRFER